MARRCNIEACLNAEDLAEFRRKAVDRNVTLDAIGQWLRRQGYVSGKGKQSYSRGTVHKWRCQVKDELDPTHRLRFKIKELVDVMEDSAVMALAEQLRVQG